MEKAVNNQRTLGPNKVPAVIITNEDFLDLWKMILRYGHYLSWEDHEKLKTLLLSPVSGPNAEFRTYSAEEFVACLKQIERNRRKLMHRLWGQKGRYRQAKNIDSHASNIDRPQNAT